MEYDEDAPELTDLWDMRDKTDQIGGVMRGTVIRVILEKRFGFIKGNDGTEYFFHQSDFNGFFDDLASDTAIGNKVEVVFEIAPSVKGPRAANVLRTDGGIIYPTA